MQAIQKNYYFPALAGYIRHGKESSLQQARMIGKQLQGADPEDLIALHEECMRTLIANVETEEALKLYNRSVYFLIEVMVAHRLHREPGEQMDQKFSEMREMLYRSNRSFEMVKSKYENILQHMDSGIALFDSDGILSFVNLQMARLLDVPRRTLIGCNFTEILSHKKLDRSKRRLILKLYKEIHQRHNTYYEIQDREGRHLLVTVTYGDELEGDLLISVKDVSEYKKIEQTALQNDKLAILGRISAGIAHEIRNPLTSIRGFIQLLKPYLFQVGKEEYFRIILAEIDRANDIIYEFLNSSKPSAPMKQIIPINELIKEVALLTESEALMRNCQINLESYSSEKELKVSVDVKQMKQVILNIVKNALDAIEEVRGERRGLIDLITREDGRYVELTIRDNGKGMDRSTLNRLFDPFFTTKQSGTGLGLSVSYRIIRNHNGTVRVNSEIDAGTSFIIYLPLAE
ncbi:ATP-binding protein [Paenibacillus protaetiae]|uniref:histidine kinase n=1 Tax=Paenibacillus protaetiae TaxID=2509456 RepID=A0A4V0YFP6_9BACL|nr:PAS domain S-box protein [Paenibacillus protaetiae]